MEIVKERTRIIFTDFTPNEKIRIDDLVGTVDKVFSYEDPDGKMICLPTGMEAATRAAFPRVPIHDHSGTYWDYATIQPVQHNAQPRNQLQIDFINFVIENAQKKKKLAGILSPGTGKTFMACYSAIKIGLRTLIIVPTTGIKVQWVETLRDMFKVDPKRITMVNQPKDFINIKTDFVVVSQASLAALNKTYDLERVMKANRFGIKVIDEVQMWFHNIIKVDGNSNILHNWYLTGTFGRSGNEENQLYQTMFGDLEMFREKDKKPTILNPKPGNVYGMKPHMHVNMMWAESGLSKEEIRAVSNSIRYSERAGKWMRYGISIPSYTELIIPEDGTMTKFLRNLLKVIRQAETSVNYGRTLILGSTINTVEIVAEHVQLMFPNKKVFTYHSRNTKQRNTEGKEQADILVSTVSSCGTGFDMKDLSKLIVFASYKSWILADQVSGRLRRRPDERDTYMWDFVDSSVPQLRAWAAARADVLKRKAKMFKVIDVK